MRKMILASTIATLTLAAGAALAGDHFKHMIPTGEGSHMAFLHSAIEKLGLTDEQKESVKQLHEEIWTKAKPLMEQHQQQMEEIHTLLDAGNANATAIGQKMIAAHAINKQVEALHEDAMERFSALLTEEQRAKLEKLEAEGPFKHRMPMDH